MTFNGMIATAEDDYCFFQLEQRCYLVSQLSRAVTSKLQILQFLTRLHQGRRQHQKLSVLCDLHHCVTQSCLALHVTHSHCHHAQPSAYCRQKYSYRLNNYPKYYHPMTTKPWRVPRSQAKELCLGQASACKAGWKEAHKATAICKSSGQS